MTPVNDAPSFVKGANQSLLEDAGEITRTGWATSISAGPNDESSQTLTFAVTNDNNALFSVQPSIASNGTLTYTIAPNATGTANVTVVLSDSGGTDNGGDDTSDPQIFTISVTSVNDAPSFTKGADQTVAEDSGLHTVTGWATNISPGPANEAGQTVAFTTTNDKNSLFSAQPTIDVNGTLTFTPAANAYGVATVSVYVTDNGGTANGGVNTSAIQTFTITITAVNDQPTVSGSTTSLAEDTSVQITLVGSDIDGDPLTYAIATQPTHGTVSIAGNIATYTPFANYNGTDSFTFTANDGTTEPNATSSPATVNITVTPVADAPSATPPGPTLSYTVVAGEKLSVAAPGLLENISDPEGGVLTVIKTSGPTTGSYVDKGNGAFEYITQPNVFTAGSDSFTYVVSDSDGNRSSTFTVSITILPNDPPTATPDTITTEEDVAYSGSVTGTDDHHTPAELTYSVKVQPLHGTLTMAANGSYTYTPNLNYNGSDSFQFITYDGTQYSTAATVDIAITPVQDAPSLTGTPKSYAVGTGSTLSVPPPGVLFGVTDVDGDSVTAELVSTTSLGTLTLDPDGSFTYISDIGTPLGSDTFVVRA